MLAAEKHAAGHGEKVVDVHGVSPTSVTPTGTPADKIIRTARKYLGVHEDPPGSNKGPLVTKWLAACGFPGGGEPWCAAFACAVLREAGHGLPFEDSASCATLRQHAHTHGLWTSKPEPGYIGIIGNDEHAVLVIDGNVHDISGNTSEADGSNYNGGNVAEHDHPLGSFAGFIRTH